MNINAAALTNGLALGDALDLDLTLLREAFSRANANSRKNANTDPISPPNTTIDIGTALTPFRKKDLSRKSSAGGRKNY